MSYLAWVGLGICCGCPRSDPAEKVTVDGDGDAWFSDVDCDDGDPAVHPNAAEICDGVDNDCDGVTDGEDAVDVLEWYPDSDADGFGADGPATFSCSQPDGTAQYPGDCDDSDSSVFPDANEVCNDGKVQNCTTMGVECSLTGEVSTSDVGAAYLEVEGNLSIATTDGGSADPWLAVGQMDRDGTGGESEAGQLEVFVAPVGTGDGPSSIITGTVEGDRVGRSVDIGPVTVDDASPLALTWYPQETDVSSTAGGVAVFYDLNGALVTNVRDADFWVYGDEGADLFGTDVSVGGDATGDGIVDLLVGAHWANLPSGSGGYDGRAYLFQGPLSATAIAASSVPGVAMIDAANADDQLGWSVSIDGDLNGDGIKEVVLGAIQWEGAYGPSTGPGYVAVFTGGSLSQGTTTADDADWVIDGISSSNADYSEKFGYTVESGSDLTGDGRDDLVVYSSQVSGWNGPTVLIDGEDYEKNGSREERALVTFQTGRPGPGGGTDFDGDGNIDLPLGDSFANSERGEVVIHYGPFVAGAWYDRDDDSSAIVMGDETGSKLGGRVVPGADLDLDGVPGVAATESGDGRVWLIPGTGL